jgi:small conductance mechanosensitive channel
MEQKAYFDYFISFCFNTGPKILGGTLFFFVGLWLIKRLIRGFDGFLKGRKVDESLRPFFTSLADTGMKVFLVLMVANTVGIQTTSFIAIFSAIAFSIGLALQGSLGNFASGVLILLFRPYKVGDQIAVGDTSGKVSEIQIFNTILMAPNGKKYIVPNGKMTEGAIQNIQESSEVIAEITLLIDPKTPADWLRATAEAALAPCPLKLPHRNVEIKITGISRDDMKVQIGCPTLGQNHDDAIDFMYDALKPAFETAGIAFAKERRRENV